MKLSEAIRLGSLMVAEPRAEDTSRCAIGMALLSQGIVPLGLRADYRTFADLYPWLRPIAKRCPMCCAELLGLSIVWHPFDEHVMRCFGDKRGMTIEQLADWVATFEPPESSPEQTELTTESELVEEKVL
jgi:hypothetical protein